MKLFGDEDQEVSTPQLEEALRNAIKAKRLLENEDFCWWRENYLHMEVEKAGEKLDAAFEHPNHANIHRGIRKGIRKVLKGLEIMAARRDFLEERLNDRNRNDEPVTRENREDL
jgi:hypothetical protein